MLLLLFFFFFKQKTAYEMRISDWSSDVCSSDLPSDDGKYFVDVYSTIDTEPVALLRDADGRLVAEIARADLTRLTASGWVPPRVFTVKARDVSNAPYGQTFQPADFDPAKQSPNDVTPYPGPKQGSTATLSLITTYHDKNK